MKRHWGCRKKELVHHEGERTAWEGLVQSQGRDCGRRHQAGDSTFEWTLRQSYCLCWCLFRRGGYYYAERQLIYYLSQRNAPTVGESQADDSSWFFLFRGVRRCVACKQAIHSENLIGFLGFCCPKPYFLYTDSTACLSIASNAFRLGNVRHLVIRYNLVRCYVTIGEVTMRYCVTEEMVADLLTKIVAGAQDARLTIRFYCLCPAGEYYVVHHM